MQDKLLIANRGEIACRIAATARRMGIATLAVYSDADANSKHVAACDEAIRLGPPPAAQSYLSIDKIIAAAKQHRATLIHPGYGFLSENAKFARACADAGLIFVGPPAEAIAAMGDKAAAKTIMEKAGVPVVPGYHNRDASDEILAVQAARVGFPVLLKAMAGGGGKGMRIVESAEAIPAALAASRREAQSAFGDAGVMLEKYLIRPRHIEVQVFADAHGNCVYLSQRDCSVQRRYQKVIEECPAPGISDERGRVMGEVAVAAAVAVGYRGAGTIEFIASGDDFYFMEMNTRLQVEHPVTEFVHGVDLVEWQLKVAVGERLPLTQDAIVSRGHAIEARIYAENPDAGFLPSAGDLSHFCMPPHVEFEVKDVVVSAYRTPDRPAVSSTIRVDSGFREGDSITAWYDPLIAKVIAYGATRAEALASLEGALAKTEIAPVTTNVEFLRRVLQTPDFTNAVLDTQLIERNRSVLFPPSEAVSSEVISLAVAARLSSERSDSDTSPWASLRSFRLNAYEERTFSFQRGEETYGVTLLSTPYHELLGVGPGQPKPFTFTNHDRAFYVTLDGTQFHGTVVASADVFHIFSEGAHTVLRTPKTSAGARIQEADAGLLAPMSGKIVAHLVGVNVEVKGGVQLLVIEAMKMEHTISAPSDGKVKRFCQQPGAQVAEGDTLVEFEARQVS